MDEADYEQVVAMHHEGLYRFAFSLAGGPDDAAELVQETFCRLLTKGSQLRDKTKVKAWMFTTLYRVFLGWKRHANRFPQVEICAVESELPPQTPEMVDQIDGEFVMETALEIEERYRAPLVLFYLQDLSYREIAELLEVPIGTVMSRLSRGKHLLRQRLSARVTRANTRALPSSPSRPRQAP